MNSERLTAVTHNGKFHADEVFASAVLRRLYPELKVIRSRDPAVIAGADIVYDVGGIYDHDQRRYDHHQNGALKREDGLTRSAFGLIWLHYGLEYCDGDEDIWQRVDRLLVRGIDAGDNGERKAIRDPRAPEFDISQVIELYNPPIEHAEEADLEFSHAMGLAALMLDKLIVRCQEDLESAAEVRAAMRAEESSRYAIIDHPIRTSDSLSAIETLEYVVFPDRVNDYWQVFAIATPEDPHTQRRPLPEEWAGLSGEALQAVSMVPDALFCHKKGFLAVAKSREGALSLLGRALAEPHHSVLHYQAHKHHS